MSTLYYMPPYTAFCLEDGYVVCLVTSCQYKLVKADFRDKYSEDVAARRGYR